MMEYFVMGIFAGVVSAGVLVHFFWARSFNDQQTLFAIQRGAWDQIIDRCKGVIKTEILNNPGVTTLTIEQMLNVAEELKTRRLMKEKVLDAIQRLVPEDPQSVIDAVADAIEKKAEEK